MLDRRTQSSHQRTRVLAESLLARYQRIAVVGVFHVAFFKIGGPPNVVVRSQAKAGSPTRKELFNRLYFLRGGFLLCNHVIQTKYHQRVGVFEQTLVNGLLLPRLVDPLVNRNRMLRNLAYQ